MIDPMLEAHDRHAAWLAGYDQGKAHGGSAERALMAQERLSRVAGARGARAVLLARERPPGRPCRAGQAGSQVVSVNRPIYLYEANARDFLIRGHIREWLKSEGIPALWSPTSKGWFVRRERVADLVARLENDGYHVRPKGMLE